MNKKIRRTVEIILTVSGKKETVLSLEKTAFSKNENEDVFFLKRKPYYFLTASKYGKAKENLSFVDDVIFEKFVEKDTEFKDREKLKDYFFFQNLIPLSKVDDRESEVDLEKRMMEEWNFLNVGFIFQDSFYDLTNNILFLPTEQKYQKDFRMSVDIFLTEKDLPFNGSSQIGTAFFEKLSLIYPDLEMNIRISNEYLDFLVFRNYFAGKLISEKNFAVGFDYDEFLEYLLEFQEITKLNAPLIEFEFEERERFYDEDEDDDEDYYD